VIMPGISCESCERRRVGASEIEADKEVVD
jgi:hypothetical protein